MKWQGDEERQNAFNTQTHTLTAFFFFYSDRSIKEEKLKKNIKAKSFHKIQTANAFYFYLLTTHF